VDGGVERGCGGGWVGVSIIGSRARVDSYGCTRSISPHVQPCIDKAEDGSHKVIIIEVDYYGRLKVDEM
jgi:hypothetical protein